MKTERAYPPPGAEEIRLGRECANAPRPRSQHPACIRYERLLIQRRGPEKERRRSEAVKELAKPRWQRFLEGMTIGTPQIFRDAREGHERPLLIWIAVWGSVGLVLFFGLRRRIKRP